MEHTFRFVAKHLAHFVFPHWRHCWLERTKLNGQTVQGPLQFVTGVHEAVDWEYVYPAKQLVHWALLVILQVAHGAWQVCAQVKADVRVYPEAQTEQPRDEQVKQNDEQAAQTC